MHKRIDSFLRKSSAVVGKVMSRFCDTLMCYYDTEDSENDRAVKKAAIETVSKMDKETKDLFARRRSLSYEEAKRLADLVKERGKVRCALTVFAGACRHQSALLKKLTTENLTEEDKNSLLESYKAVLKEKEAAEKRCRGEQD